MIKYTELYYYLFTSVNNVNFDFVTIVSFISVLVCKICICISDISYIGLLIDRM